MTISRLLTAALMFLGLLATLSFAYTGFKSFRDYRTVDELSALAQARTEWMNGTVALSLEPSVVQVALSVDGIPDQRFLDIIDAQRDMSDTSFEQANGKLASLPNLTTFNEFDDLARNIQDEVARLRAEVNLLLSKPKTERNPERRSQLPSELKFQIERLKTLTELMSPQPPRKLYHLCKISPGKFVNSAAARAPIMPSRHFPKSRYLNHTKQL
jgi:hypothetical protein